MIWVDLNYFICTTNYYYLLLFIFLIESYTSFQIWWWFWDYLVCSLVHILTKKGQNGNTTYLITFLVIQCACCKVARWRSWFVTSSSQKVYQTTHQACHFEVFVLYCTNIYDVWVICSAQFHKHFSPMLYDPRSLVVGVCYHTLNIKQGSDADAAVVWLMIYNDRVI